MPALGDHGTPSGCDAVRRATDHRSTAPSADWVATVSPPVRGLVSRAAPASMADARRT